MNCFSSKVLIKGQFQLKFLCLELLLKVRKYLAATIFLLFGFLSTLEKTAAIQLKKEKLASKQNILDRCHFLTVE